MAKIVIDVVSLRASAAALEARIGELQSINARLEALITRIRASWEGQASDTYIAKLTAQATKAKKMVDVLREYKRYIDSAVSRFSNIDNNWANKIKGSF